MNMNMNIYSQKFGSRMILILQVNFGLNFKGKKNQPMVKIYISIIYKHGHIITILTYETKPTTLAPRKHDRL